MRPHLWLPVLLTLGAAPAVAQKTPDVRLDTSPQSARSAFPDVASSGDAVYVTWEDDRNGWPDIYFNRSFDRGASWLAADVRLDTDPPGAAGSSSPRIAASGLDVHVVWSDDRLGSGIYYNRSLDGGTTWMTSDLVIDRGTGAGTRLPQIATVGAAVYVVWEDDRNGYSAIYFNRSLNRGAPGSWLVSDVRLGTGRLPRLAAWGSSIYVTWDSLGVWFNRSLDWGSTWLATAIPVNSGPAPRWSSPRIAASGASVYVTWTDERNGKLDIYFNRSIDSGSTWLAADVRLNTNPAGQSYSQFPVIAAVGTSVYVAWDDDRAGQLPYFHTPRTDIHFNRSLDGGSTWLANDVRLNTNAPGSSHSGQVDIAASGSAVFVTLADDRNLTSHAMESDIYFNRSMDQGTSWLASDVRLDTDPPGNAISDRPRIAASDSSVYVAWWDGRNGSSDIYFNIPFGFQDYGPGTAGSGGIVPQLSGSGYATLGSTPSIDVSSGLGGAAGGLLLGVGPQSQVSLPILGGTLLVQPAISIPTALGGAAGSPGGGTGTLPLNVPANPALVGVNLNFQAVLIDAGAPSGLSMTNAVEMWIG